LSVESRGLSAIIAAGHENTFLFFGGLVVSLLKSGVGNQLWVSRFEADRCHIENTGKVDTSEGESSSRSEQTSLRGAHSERSERF
jgi:hypothetical protein